MKTIAYSLPKLLLIGAIGFIVVCGDARVQGQDSVYVTNASSNSVSVIDARSLSVVATISVGSSPQGAGVSPDGTRLVVANTEGSQANTVSIIDTLPGDESYDQVIGTVSVGNFPLGIGFSPDSSKAYVVNAGDLSVSTVDLIHKMVTNTSSYAFGGNPNRIAVSSDGRRAYISVGANSVGNVSIIDLINNVLISSITIPGTTDLRQVALSPDGTKLYVVSVFSSDVSVIDTGTNTILARIPVGSLPIGMAITPDGKHAFVGASNGPVSVIDLSTNTVIANVPVIGNPAGVAISADGLRAFVANQGSAAIAIDAATFAVEAEIQTGSQAYWVAASPAKACEANASSLVAFSGSGFSYNFGTRRFVQTVTLTNTSSTSIPGPIAVALDQLSSTASMYQPAGRTSCSAPLGSPYVTAAGPLAPGASFSINLQFTDPTKAAITYQPRVLAGAGVP